MQHYWQEKFSEPLFKQEIRRQWCIFKNTRHVLRLKSKDVQKAWAEADAELVDVVQSNFTTCLYLVLKKPRLRFRQIPKAQSHFHISGYNKALLELSHLCLCMYCWWLCFLCIRRAEESWSRLNSLKSWRCQLLGPWQKNLIDSCSRFERAKGDFRERVFMCACIHECLCAPNCVCVEVRGQSPVLLLFRYHLVYLCVEWGHVCICRCVGAHACGGLSLDSRVHQFS